jgi:hypothetical protein
MPPNKERELLTNTPHKNIISGVRCQPFPPREKERVVKDVPNMAEGGEGHWRTQANAANALAVIGVRSDEVEMALVTCIQSEIRQVREAGERAINRLWPEN